MRSIVFAWLLLSLGALAQPAPEAPAAARLYVINDSGWTLVPSNQAVTDNGKPLVSLPRQTYKLVSIPPGPHVLRPDPPLWNQQVTLAAEPGRSYYVVIAYKPESSWALPFAGPPLLLKELSEEQGLRLIADMKSL